VHAAVQGVVLDRLPVRAVRALGERGAVVDEAGMAAAPVAAAVLQVVVEFQPVPARREGLQVVEGAAGEAGDVLRTQQGIAVRAQRIDDARGSE
jgi:hypothetical protein